MNRLSLRSLDTISSKDVYEAAKEGDRMALKIFNSPEKMLGASFADFVAFSAPEAVCFFSEGLQGPRNTFTSRFWIP